MILKIGKDTAYLLKVLSAVDGRSAEILIEEIIDKAGKEYLKNLISFKANSKA